MISGIWSDPKLAQLILTREKSWGMI